MLDEKELVVGRDVAVDGADIEKTILRFGVAVDFVVRRIVGEGDIGLAFGARGHGAVNECKEAGGGDSSLQSFSTI